MRRRAGASSLTDTHGGSPKGHYVNLGSIPARAGEPAQGRPGRPLRPVYPRACGGTTAGTIWPWPPGGLSPRVRGNRLAISDVQQAGLSPRVRGNRMFSGRTVARSIPARAGEPWCSLPPRCRRRVYPRACGGTGIDDDTNLPFMGLSPRVRGNRKAAHCHQLRDGSIPARAGNLSYPSGGVFFYRSIPARAGEPCRPRPVCASGQVYPRACGGTLPSNNWPTTCGGLSPRVRGNHCAFSAGHQRHGSIPARAGEPEELQFVLGGHPGLSPRVRGNPMYSNGRRFRTGSIPARAGEPSGPDRYISTAPVYPRACGGTRAIPPSTIGVRGSIPARAGEPSCQGDKRHRSRGVYPRACGGTVLDALVFVAVGGLSPRVRGNRAMRCHSSPLGVYPRACGGTVLDALVFVAVGGLSPRVRGNQAAAYFLIGTVRSIPARAGEPPG